MIKSHLIREFFDANFYLIEEAMEWEDIPFDGTTRGMMDAFEWHTKKKVMSAYKGYHDSVVPFMTVATVITAIQLRNENFDLKKDARISWTLFRITSEVVDWFENGDFSKKIKIINEKEIVYVRGA